MDNQEIRRILLELLYNHGMSEMSIGILEENLGIGYGELDPNINYLEDKGYIKGYNSLEGYYAAKITAKGIDYIENKKEVKPQVTQHFHGNIENFALGDINNYNTSIYLNALINAIEESDEISTEEKQSLIYKIKTVAENPHVAGISSGLIVEGIKAVLMGFKPF
jgi:hypothetical protein